MVISRKSIVTIAFFIAFLSKNQIAQELICTKKIGPFETKINKVTLTNKDIAIVETNYDLPLKNRFDRFDRFGLSGQTPPPKRKDITTGETNGGKIIIIDITNGNIIDTINGKQILNSLDSLYLALNPKISYVGFFTNVTYKEDMPCIQIFLKSIGLTTIRKKSLEYNIIQKKFYKIDQDYCEQEDTQKKYTMQIQTNVNIPEKKIIHDDYIVTLGFLTLKIKHTNKTKTLIPLKHRTKYNIFASPKKGSRYIVLHNYEHSKNRAYSGFIDNIVLYDNQTGDVIKNLKLEKIYPDLIGQHLRDIIFGKDDNFMLLVFKNKIILYDINILRAAYHYTHDKKIKKTLLSNNNKHIILEDGACIYIIDNPFANHRDQDEIERRQYLFLPNTLDTLYPKGGQNFSVIMGHQETRIFKLFIKM